MDDTKAHHAGIYMKEFQKSKRMLNFEEKKLFGIFNTHCCIYGNVEKKYGNVGSRIFLHSIHWIFIQYPLNIHWISDNSYLKHIMWKITLSVEHYTHQVWSNLKSKCRKLQVSTVLQQESRSRLGCQSFFK